MECIICQDSGAEPLQNNKLCSCNYKRHSSCWINYINSTSTVKCLMCRKDLTTKQITKIKSSITTLLRPPPLVLIPYSHRIHEETGQRITYREFIDIVNQSNSYQNNTRIQIQSLEVIPNPISNTEKVLRIVLCLCISIISVIIFSIIF